MDIESGHIDHPFISVDETLLRTHDDGKRMRNPSPECPEEGNMTARLGWRVGSVPSRRTVCLSSPSHGEYHQVRSRSARLVPDSSPGWAVPGAPFFDRQVMTLEMVLRSSAETVLDRRVS